MAFLQRKYIPRSFALQKWQGESSGYYSFVYNLISIETAMNDRRESYGNLQPACD